MTRYRLQDDTGRAWDAEDGRWNSLTTGYTTYKTLNQALSAARRTKATRFQTASNIKAVENTPPTEWA